MLEDAEIMQGVIGLGGVAENIEIGLARFVEPALAMELQCVIECGHGTR